MWAEGYSSLDATCFRLAQAEQARVPFADASMRHAAQFLRERQRPDGAWEEEASVANLAPPWARPGDPATRRYLTANCAFWCAMLGARDAAERGAAALERESDAPAFAQTLWLTAGLAYLLGRPTAAARPLDELAARLDDLPAGSLTWMLTTLLLAGVATTHPLVHDAAMRLEDMQRADGSWPSDEGDDRVVHVTLEALRALRLRERLSEMRTQLLRRYAR